MGMEDVKRMQGLEYGSQRLSARHISHKGGLHGIMATSVESRENESQRSSEESNKL